MKGEVYNTIPIECESSSFESICSELIELQNRKNQDYGNSFSENVSEFGMVAAIIPITNKTNRLKQLTKQEAQVKSESIRDTLVDLACYAIMALQEVDKLNK